MPTPTENTRIQRELMALGLSRADAVLVCDDTRLVASKGVPGNFASLKEKIRAEKFWRGQRAEAFARLYMIAHEAALEAGEAHPPTPMIVQEHANPLDDNSPIVKQYEPVRDGVCGFAWVTVRPATSSFARWAKENHGWRKAYTGGMQLWVKAFGQSMERKEQYARVFARVLSLGGVPASAGSRMD